MNVGIDRRVVKCLVGDDIGDGAPCAAVIRVGTADGIVFTHKIQLLDLLARIVVIHLDIRDIGIVGEVKVRCVGAVIIARNLTAVAHRVVTARVIDSAGCAAARCGIADVEGRI